MTDGTDRPQTLLVSPWTPYPLVFGGAIRVYYLIKMLASFSDVTLVAFRSWSDVDDVDDAPRVDLPSGSSWSTASPSRRGRLRVRSTLSRRSFQYHAHHTDADAAHDRRGGRVDARSTTSSSR